MERILFWFAKGTAQVTFTKNLIIRQIYAFSSKNFERTLKKKQGYKFLNIYVYQLLKTNHGETN